MKKPINEQIGAAFASRPIESAFAAEAYRREKYDPDHPWRCRIPGSHGLQNEHTSPSEGAKKRRDYIFTTAKKK